MDNNEKLDILYIITLVIEKNIIEDFRYNKSIYKELSENNIINKQLKEQLRPYYNEIYNDKCNTNYNKINLP